MKTQCIPIQLEFLPLGHRKVTARFDGGRLSSDAGGMLLGEADARIGLLDRAAQCFQDYRDHDAVEHSVRDLVAQRIYALALGYEDLNDHDELRRDSLLAMMVGMSDIVGETRARARDGDGVVPGSGAQASGGCGVPGVGGGELSESPYAVRVSVASSWGFQSDVRSSRAVGSRDRCGELRQVVDR